MIKVYYKRDTLYILLLLNNIVTGIIKVFKRTDKQGILDIFIRPLYRSRWVTKTLYYALRDVFVEICRCVGYNVVLTRLNNIKSLRLLTHFGFIKYNEKYYYLEVL